MTSFKQIQANRANAGKSTGPVTDEGKRRSRCNAVRHGLTAETVIGALENAEDYKAFEAAIAADYDAQSAVERELVLRLASLLWRLRRATAIETGLFDIEADPAVDFEKAASAALQIVPMAPRSERIGVTRTPFAQSIGNGATTFSGSALKSAETAAGIAAELGRCFRRLADLPNFALDRLTRYEAALWRQVGQILFALDALDRRKPQERRHGF